MKNVTAILVLLVLFITPLFGPANAEAGVNNTTNITAFIKKVSDVQVTWTPGEDLTRLNSQFTGFTSSQPSKAINRSGSKLVIWEKINGASPVVELNGSKYCSENCQLLFQYGNNMGISGAPLVSIDENIATTEYTVTYEWTETVCSSDNEESDSSRDTTGESNAGWSFSSTPYAKQEKHVLRLYFEDSGGSDGEDSDDDSDGPTSTSCTTVNRSETLTISETYAMPPVHPSSLIDYGKQNIIVLQNIPGGQRVLANNSNGAYQFNYDIHTSNGTAEIKKYYYTILKGENSYYAIANKTRPEDLSKTELAMGISRTGDLIMPVTEILSATSYDLFGKGHGIANINVRKENVDKSLSSWNILFTTIILSMLIYKLMQKPQILK